MVNIFRTTSKYLSPFSTSQHFAGMKLVLMSTDFLNFFPNAGVID